MKTLKFLILLMLLPAVCFGGASVDFNGTTDLINVGSGSSLDNLSSYSICAWIKPSGYGEGTFGRIYDKGGKKTFFLDNDATAPSATLRAIIDYDIGSDTARSAEANFIPLNVWSFVCMTWSGNSAASSISFYKNGVESSSYGQETGGSSGNAVSDSSDDGILGNNAGATRTFDGLLSNPHIFNRAITTVDILNIMNFPGTITNALVGFWTLFGDSAENDLSGNGNNGTLTGTTASSDGPPISFGGGLDL